MWALGSECKIYQLNYTDRYPRSLTIFFLFFKGLLVLIILEI